MDAQKPHLMLALAFSLLALTGALTMLGTWAGEPPVARAQVDRSASDHHIYLPLIFRGGGPIRYVAPTGGDCGDCADPVHPCATVQYAVDRAAPGNEVRVATGVYTGVQTRAVPPDYPSPPASGFITQTVYTSKTITIRGGYTSNFADPPDPDANPTTLDAQGQGRVLYITGNISPTIEGLRITGGDAARLGGGSSWRVENDAGGGVHIRNATAIFRNNRVFSNTANSGGGLYLHDSAATLSGNTITTNIARTDGLSLSFGTATPGDEPTPPTPPPDGGGGLYLFASAATLNGNVISSNAATGTYGEGGGVCVFGRLAALNGNTITNNTASSGGGGLILSCADAVLNGNIITANTAHYGGGVLLVGGVYFADQSMLSGNTITVNTADLGGGLYLHNSDASLRGNTISSNAADLGGGLYLKYSGIPTLTNDVVADNQANIAGSGLYIDSDYSEPRLLHTTIARNRGGDGSGVHVTGWSSAVTLINTILVSHTVGITITAGNTAILEGTLWGDGVWANETDQGGAGIISSMVDVQGDPDFVDPENGDHHIGAGSAAIDAGVASGVTTDIDGDPRPAAFGFDIGADEHFGPLLQLHKAAWPPASNVGQNIVYTLVVTNIGTYTATNVWLTDTLPALQQAVAIDTTRGTCTAGAGWGDDSTCDLGAMAPGDTACITLTAQVTTTLPTQLPWLMRNTAWVTATETVASAYVDTVLHDCHVRLNDSLVEYTTVQAAIDASTQPTDVVKVAGTCGGVMPRAGGTQIAYLTKTLTLQGGWDLSFTQRDVIGYPTTLDALGRGRVLHVTGDISPTIEGLHITGGSASGVYIGGTRATFSDNRVLSNTALYGGGLYLNESHATISGNVVTANTAEDGGGLYLNKDHATLNGNTITTNTATSQGGGLKLWYGDATLDGNIITTNTAASLGGGLRLYESDAMLNGNTITANTAEYEGGGLFLQYCDAMLSGNTITANIAGRDGGGLSIVDSRYRVNNATLLINNVITDNRANGYGGGLLLQFFSAALINNVVADNQAYAAGSGLYIEGCSPRLRHTTIARNSGGAGSGVYVTEHVSSLGPKYNVYSTVILTNTILDSHTVGLIATSGNTATLEATLWANDTNWSGEGVISRIHDVYGDPAFVNPSADDYHIGPGSTAWNAGVDAGVTTDMDGDDRPDACFFDIGADEFVTGLECKYLYLPLVLRDANTH